MIRAAQKAIESQEEVTLDYAIKNTDRAVGTMLSGVIAQKYGEAGLPDSTIKIKFKGSAGQSFGAFAVKGLDIRLEGETNDYFGKGLSGGRISLRKGSFWWSHLDSAPSPSQRRIQGRGEHHRW